VEVDMKIKRYIAESMRAALAQVRAEQGPDAVILSSRRGQEGIEVIAAVDYDEALFADARQQRIAQQAAAGPTAAAAPAPAVPAPAVPALAVPPPAAPPPAATRRAAAIATRVVPQVAARAAPIATRAVPPRSDAGFSGAAMGLMQREMQDMRRLLETGLAGMTWNDKRLREPLKAQVLEQLTAMDIAPDVALAIAEQTPRRTSLTNSANIPLALLIKHLPIGRDQTCVSGGITALVGPTGAGKTTTIAKLAARWCLAHGSKDLALVSTDAYRIGAREQLMTYARILDAPMYTANSGNELRRLLVRLSAKKLVLIDTAGMGPRDVRLNEQLAALKLGAAKAQVLLALPAHGEGQALEEIVRAFAGVSPQACVLTKVDEAASLGGVLSASIRHKLKIAYLCNGQRVPEDLHAAEPRRVWLVRAALHMKRGTPRVRDEAYLARTFGRVHAHG
jgi:flagellar biosynthesis protein FlhF